MTAPEGFRAIAVDGLSKRVASRQVLDGLTFSVREGEVFGLVGPVGAGKTTTLRILATLVRPDAGRATVDGVAVDEDRLEARRRLGYLPASFGAHRRQTALEYVEFYAAIHGVPRQRQRSLAGELLEVMDLSDRGDDYVDSFDRGEVRRLGLARALVHEPAVLLLDEPLSGLDASTQDSVRNLVSELGRMGKTVLLTARRLADVDGTCSSVGVLESGRLSEDGSADVDADSVAEGERARA